MQQPCTDANHYMTCRGGEGSEYDSEVACPGSTPVCVATGSADHVCQSQDQVDCVTPLVGFRGADLRATDLNGDALTDLVYLNLGVLTIALAAADQPLLSPVALSAAISEFRVAQLNADRVPDLLVLDASGYLSVLFGKGDGTFDAQLHTARRVERLLGAGDLDGDAIEDVIVQSAPARYAWLSSARDFGFPELAVTLPGTATEARVTFDPSGASQLVISDDSGHTSVFAREGAGFHLLQTLLGSLVFAGDFNHDDLPDLLLEVVAGTVVELGQGGGKFEVSTHVDGSPLLAADLDADGNLDLLLQRGNGSVPLHGHGDGSFEEGPALGIPDLKQESTVFVTTARGGELIFGTSSWSRLSPSCVMR